MNYTKNHLFSSQSDATVALYETLPKDHLILTFVNEHKQIMTFLNRLGKTRKNILSLSSPVQKPELFSELTHISELLLDAEPHHQREERVLFPEMEQRGVTGPPYAMLLEHKAIRDLKHKLKSTALRHQNINFEEFKSRLDFFANGIIQLLPDHIYKEDHVLYPMALNIIKGKQTWEKMKTSCDEIGYCSFTTNT